MITILLYHFFTVISRITYNMEHHFAIVKFLEEDDALDIVAINWTYNDETMTLYPKVSSTSKKEKLLKMEVVPDNPDEWQKCRIKIIHKFGKMCITYCIFLIDFL